LKHLRVVKKSGQIEKYAHAKLFSSIYRAAISARRIDRVRVTEKTTTEVEKIILGLNKKEISTYEIAQIAMKVLVKINFGVFLRYLTYYTEVEDSAQLLGELAKYTR
jgi:transcriptional regulator NrdR family protein